MIKESIGRFAAALEKRACYITASFFLIASIMKKVEEKRRKATLAAMLAY